MRLWQTPALALPHQQLLLSSLCDDLATAAKGHRATTPTARSVCKADSPTTAQQNVVTLNALGQ